MHKGMYDIGILYGLYSLTTSVVLLEVGGNRGINDMSYSQHLPGELMDMGSKLGTIFGTTLKTTKKTPYVHREGSLNKADIEICGWCRDLFPDY